MSKAAIRVELADVRVGKLQKLEELLREYIRVLNAYVNWLLTNGRKQVNPHAVIPEWDVPSFLPFPWLQQAWAKACALVQFKKLDLIDERAQSFIIYAYAPAVLIERSKTTDFDIWLRVAGPRYSERLYIPIRFVEEAKKLCSEFPVFRDNVSLEKLENQWFATLLLDSE